MATSITATCACKSFTLTTSFPTSYLPLPRALCLCTACGHVSGSIGGNTYIQLMPPPFGPHLDPSTITTEYPSLKYYSTSDKLTRYWCGKCSAQIFVHRLPDQTWHLATGLWDQTEGVVQWTGSKWVEDTKDGGLSVWLREIEGDDEDASEKKDKKQKTKLKRWVLADRGADAQLVTKDRLTTSAQRRKSVKEGEGEDEGKQEEEEKLHASCHCKGVQFYITRPNTHSATAHSPFPDLMIPYHAGVSAANPNHEPWFLRADGKKYLAGTCTCPSCRQALGFEIQTWAFIPKCNIFAADGTALDYAKLGTLKRYDSKEGVYREFCGTCGAGVFWHCDERPEVVDVGVGLFEAEEGARCESWLDWWTERVSFAELAVSHSLVKALGEGMKAWGEEQR